MWFMTNEPRKMGQMGEVRLPCIPLHVGYLRNRTVNWILPRVLLETTNRLPRGRKMLVTYTWAIHVTCTRIYVIQRQKRGSYWNDYLFISHFTHCYLYSFIYKKALFIFLFQKIKMEVLFTFFFNVFMLIFEN